MKKKDLCQNFKEKPRTYLKNTVWQNYEVIIEDFVFHSKCNRIFNHNIGDTITLRYVWPTLCSQCAKY
jgi:hypothetical protein